MNTTISSVGAQPAAQTDRRAVTLGMWRWLKDHPQHAETYYQFLRSTQDPRQIEEHNARQFAVDLEGRRIGL